MGDDKKDSQKLLRSVYLDPTTDTRLAARAEAEGTDKSELMRQFIVEGLSRPASMFSGYAPEAKMENKTTSGSKPDKLGFRKLAEAWAASQGDASEKNVQRILKRFEEDYEAGEVAEKEIVKTEKKEKRYLTIGWLLMFIGFACLIIGVFWFSGLMFFHYAGSASIIIGFITVVVVEEKRSKRNKDLSPEGDKNE